jgi:hypothetical protein
MFRLNEDVATTLGNRSDIVHLLTCLTADLIDTRGADSPRRREGHSGNQVRGEPSENPCFETGARSATGAPDRATRAGH